MTAISLTVDGVRVEVGAGASLLDAVLAAGQHVPHLCKDADQAPIGACRTCLVEIEGLRGLRASCHTPAAEGMAVSTSGAAVERVRRTVLELTAAMVDRDAVSSDSGVAGELHGELERYGVRAGRYAARPRAHVDDSSPFFLSDFNACILCGRCVDACQDVQHIGAIARRGNRTGRARSPRSWTGRSSIRSAHRAASACRSARRARSRPDGPSGRRRSRSPRSRARCRPSARTAASAAASRCRWMAKDASPACSTSRRTHRARACCA